MHRADSHERSKFQKKDESENQDNGDQGVFPVLFFQAVHGNLLKKKVICL